MSGLFGALDVTEIQEVPADGTHPFILKKVREQHTKTDKDFLVFEFTLNKPGDAFHNTRADKWFRIYPDMTEEKYNDLDEDEIAQFTKDVNQLKTFLRTLKMTDEDIKNPDWTDLTGLEGSGYGFSRDNRNGEGKEWVLWSFKPE